MSSTWEYVYLNDFGDYGFERLTLKDVINLTRYYLSIRKKLKWLLFSFLAGVRVVRHCMTIVLFGGSLYCPIFYSSALPLFYVCTLFFSITWIGNIAVKSITFLHDIFWQNNLLISICTLNSESINLKHGHKNKCVINDTRSEIFDIIIFLMRYQLS